MKRTVTISVPTLVLLGVVAAAALGIVTTTNSSAQSAEYDGSWVLQPRRCHVGGSSNCKDAAYLFNVHTGEVFLIDGTKKRPVTEKKN